MINKILTAQMAKEIQEKMELVEVDASNKTFKVVASMEVEDRDGEIVELAGLDVTNYLKNPIVLIDHDYEMTSIGGKVTRLYKEDNKLIAEGVFAKSNPKAQLLSDLYDEGMIKTVSIGFIAKQKQDNRYTQSELIELSFVVVPSNPEALSLDQKSLIKKGQYMGIVRTLGSSEKEDVEDETKNEKNILLEIKKDITEIKSYIIKQKDIDEEVLQDAELAEKLKETTKTINKATSERLQHYKRSQK